jgi:hypothetical protein
MKSKSLTKVLVVILAITFALAVGPAQAADKEKK